MQDEQSEIVREFIIECIDQLDEVDNDLLILESDPNNRDIIGKIFRAYHNMKGTSGFLNFSKLESLTHIGENLLSKMRDGLIVLNSEITSALIAMGDAVREIFKKIEETGRDGENDHHELKERLTAVLNSNQSTEAVPKSAEGTKDALDLEIEAALKMAKERRDKAKTDEGIKEKNVAPEVQKKPETLKKVNASVAGESGKSITDSSIRVDLDVLDRMMNLVGELVLTRNQVLQSFSKTENTFAAKSLQILNRITSDLQVEVMKTRMQPINNIFSKFPRIVRSLSESISKKINLEIEGKDTELDRTLIDSLRDPLTHMIRNSVDHGIELPAKRIENGKPEVGTITLKAYHESGLVNIEIIDDGGGMDAEKLKAKAIEKSLITEEQAAQMQESDALKLIFMAGFSTAETVTNISGRGVGMDVVKTNIEKIGGTVEISSVVGEGSLFSIKVPLTLAIVPALIVGAGESRIAIPQVNLKELHRLEKDQTDKIETIHGTPIFHLRDESIPLINLNDELSIKSNLKEKSDEVYNIVVLTIENQLLGLVVDEIFETQEIVVKPLPVQLEGLNVYSGVTILGDGKIALIIDGLGLAYRAKAISKTKKSLLNLKDHTAIINETLSRILLCKTIDDGRVAVELDKIQRLETIDKKEFERVGDTEVVQYRGKGLLIYRTLDLLPERRKVKRIPEGRSPNEFLDFLDDDQVHVVIYSIQGYEVGLVVGKILDSIEVDLTQMGASTRKGVEGTVIQNNKVIEVLNIEKMILDADPQFHQKKIMERASNE